MADFDMQGRVDKLHTQLEQLCGASKVPPGIFEEWEANALRLLNIAPDDPRLCFMLGVYYMRRDQCGLSVGMLKRAIECGVYGPEPWLNLGVAYKLEHFDKESKACYEKAIKLAEAEPELDENGLNRPLISAYHGIGGLYVNAGAPSMCIHWSDKALALDPTDRYARWNKGLAQLECGEWEDGFREYDEAGFISTPTKPMERKLKTYGGLPKWDGTPGQTVICYGEQGVGDEVMFASMLPDLMKQCKVIIDCDKRLLKLFKDSFPEAEAVYPTSDIDAPFPWITDHKVDAYLPMGSLGKWFRKRDADFPKTPFLIEDKDRRRVWEKRLQGFDGLRVGISYCGGLKKTRIDKRTIALEKWAPILNLENCHFSSLQYQPFGADEAAMIGAENNVAIHHWQDVIDSYDETAAFVKELDIVVSVNTSLVHLCGALGVPTLCLTPKYVAWRYGVKGPNPFYGSVEMLRQTEDGDWTNVLKAVREKLSRLSEQKLRRAA